MNNIGQEVRLKENFECDLTLTITDLQPLLSNYSEDRRNAVEKPIPSIFLFQTDYKDNIFEHWEDKISSILVRKWINIKKIKS